MLQIKFSRRFKREYRQCVKRGCNPQKIAEVIGLLQQQIPLPPEYLDHALVPSRLYKNARECHLAPDWLLIYQVEESTLTLRLVRTGSHSDLF